MFSFNPFHAPVRPFNTQYRCYSVSMLPGNKRRDVEKGGRIIMPPSSLEHLTRLDNVYPMLFKLTNKKANRITHCGVLEFVADEGKVYLPYWMMRNLLLEEGQMLHIENATLPVATFSKFQPQSEDFLDITNPKAVLENALRDFACLTTGDLIAIEYNDKIYEFCVLETKPQKAVSIIECDMNVDFDAPVGYKEPEHKPAIEGETQPVINESDIPPIDQSFIAFNGLPQAGEKVNETPKPPKKNSLREDLMMFRAQERKKSAPSAAARTAACIEKEHLVTIQYMEKEDKRKEERQKLDQQEQELRIEIMKEKLKLTKTKTLIHEKILSALNENPSCADIFKIINNE